MTTLLTRHVSTISHGNLYAETIPQYTTFLPSPPPLPSPSFLLHPLSLSLTSLKFLSPLLASNLLPSLFPGQVRYWSLTSLNITQMISDIPLPLPSLPFYTLWHATGIAAAVLCLDIILYSRRYYYKAVYSKGAARVLSVSSSNCYRNASAFRRVTRF